MRVGHSKSLLFCTTALTALLAENARLARRLDHAERANGAHRTRAQRQRTPYMYGLTIACACPHTPPTSM